MRGGDFCKHCLWTADLSVIPSNREDAVLLRRGRHFVDDLVNEWEESKVELARRVGY